MMKKLDKIKIYFHQSVYLNLPIKAQRHKRNFFLQVGLALWQILFEFCFRVGNWIINNIKTAVIFLARDLKSTKTVIVLRMKTLLKLEFVKTLGLFAALCLIGALSLQLLQIAAQAFELKQVILNQTVIGSQHLIEAKNALTQQNFSIAQSYFSAAYLNFTSARRNLEQTQGLISNLLKALPVGKQADELLKSASAISQSGIKAVDLLNDASKMKFTASGLKTTEPVGEVFEKIEGGLNYITENLQEAETKLSSINKKSLLLTSKTSGQQFLELESKVKVLKQTFLNLKDTFAIFKGISLGKKNILVLFENNNELRATGGFLGSYGIFTTKDGEILKMHISSIYDLDGQLKEKILPPQPIFSVNNRWFLRDSNWFAHFPDSAKKIISFYEKEGGETPDLVIALTPNLIIDILKITGPIPLPNYQVTLNSDNFVEATQVTSSVTYQSPENNPKQILADLLPIILQKVSEFNLSQWQVLLEDLQKNVSEKQIIFYARDEGLQNRLANYQLTGEVLPTDKDYLSIVGSNLGATKTDLYVNQNINLKSTVQNDGSIINELTIVRTNTMPKMEKTYNLSFLRVYVPLGSNLISNSGFDYQNLDIEKPQGYKIDSEAYDWEKKSVKDMVTGTIIGQESGKTFFGNWSRLDGGETKTIKLTYLLPFKLKSVDHFSLLIQKQSGAKEQKFNYEFNFSGRKIEWKNFEPTQLEAGHLSYETTLNKDLFLGAVLIDR